jgi:hypothetical protein
MFIIRMIILWNDNHSIIYNFCKNHIMKWIGLFLVKLNILGSGFIEFKM